MRDLGSYCELIAAILDDTHPGKAEALRGRMQIVAYFIKENVDE